MDEGAPMTRPSRFWRFAAVIFVFINVAGALYAVVVGEQMHAETHLALLLVTFVGYLVWRGAPQSRRQDLPPAEQADPRVEYLQQSVDAMALEVERLGEAQRFNEKLKAKRKESPDGP
jgi:hypothetical protein